ncbi:hypothetical protein KEF85_05565 [Methylomonas paludis]|uniref:DUF2971 domain-containing protein n=1 Tax=Methylomonas paludis TaxID=1173101 RepID=A0A975MQH2_9GAMM|nr:hypothetical protein [Methylomonas paludis]QWF71925.1 hypothetical protein KEF85_05565 [Methylomonas paludis]
MEKALEHPSFPQPPSESVSLWRYMDINKFEWMLENGRLFIPNADRLGDPLEGRTPQGYIDWCNRNIEKATTDESKAIHAYNRDVIFKFAQAFRPRYYVTCWHMNEHESDEMWKCYTNSNEAVAIKTTYKQLVDILPDYTYTGIVRYIDYSTEKFPFGNLFEHITHKDRCFSYEQEVRGVVSPMPEAPENSPPAADFMHFIEHHFELSSDSGFYVFAPPIDCSLLVNAVVLHPDCNEAFQDRINKLCSKHSRPNPERSHQKPRVRSCFLPNSLARAHSSD